MAETKINRRDQIKELINTGEYTKKEVAAEIGIKESGVSSQLTYLRWMGNFIIWDENKKLSFTDEAGYSAWETANKAGAKAKSVSTRTPAEQFAALGKTITNQKATLAKWVDKLGLLQAEKQEDPTLLPEAEANITLLEIKLGRNEDKLATLDFALEDADVEEVDDSDEDLL